MDDSIIPLLANISVPCSDEKRLFDSLKNALSWNFNSDDGSNPLKALQLISPKQAVAWIKGISVADSLVNSDGFGISGPLSAVFQYPGAALSSLVEVSLKTKGQSIVDSNKMDGIVDILKKKFRGDVNFFRSYLRFVCHFTSSAFAELGLRLIQQIVADQEKENSSNFIIRQLMIKDHKIFECSYQGSTNFSTICGDLLLRKRSVFEVICEKLDFLTEKPLILSVHSTSQESTSSVEPIYIICATAFDWRLLSNCPNIPLNGGQIVFREFSAKQRGDEAVRNDRPPRYDVYIYW